MFSCFFRSVFADVFSFYLLCGVGGDSFSACGPRCFCQQLAGGLRVLRLACAACRLPAASRGRRFSLTPSRLLACTSEMQEFAASPAAARALCRRWARVLHLCFRPACLASFRFCEGFHACRLFARPVCCLRGFSLLSFAFSCLTFASQKSFHLSLMPRRAPHFLFGKKMGEKNREGLRPFEPHSCALSPINLFFSLLAGLTALRAANRRLTGETPGKPKEQSSAFRAFLCAGERLAPRFTYSWKFSAGFRPVQENRSPALGPHPERAACVRDAGKEQTRCASCSAQPRPFGPQTAGR